MPRSRSQRSRVLLTGGAGLIDAALGGATFAVRGTGRQARALLSWSPTVELEAGIAEQIAHNVAGLIGTSSVEEPGVEPMTIGPDRLGSRS